MKTFVSFLAVLSLLVMMNFTFIGCSDDGGPCDELENKTVQCMDDFCSGKTCKLCECWNDGHKSYNPQTDQCEESGESDQQPNDEECQQALDQFNCNDLQSMLNMACQ